MRTSTYRLVLVLALIALLIITGVPTGILYRSGLLDQPTYVSVAAVFVMVAVALTSRHWAGARSLYALPLAFFGIILVSISLSASATTQLRQHLSLGAALLLGLALACMKYRHAAKLWILASAIVAVSALVLLVSPWRDMSVDRVEFRTTLPWSDIAGFGSTAGLAAGAAHVAMLSATSLILLSSLPFSARKRLVAALPLVASIILAGNATTLVALAVAFACIGVVSIMTPQAKARALLLGTIFLGPLLIAIGAIGADLLFKGLGRSQSLTGRLPVWSGILSEIAYASPLGLGHAGFWQESSRTRALWVLEAGWSPGSAHNTYLEAVLLAGPLGLALYLSLVLVPVVRIRLFSSSERKAVVGLVAYVLIVGLTGSAFVLPTLGAVLVAWIFFFSTILPEKSGHRGQSQGLRSSEEFHDRPNPPPLP